MPLAVTSKGYIAELPDGRLVQTPFTNVQSATQPIKKSKTTLSTVLFKTPAMETPPVTTIPAGASVSVLGYFNEYAFVRSGETEGWVLETSLKS